MYELAKGPDREHSEDEARSLLQAAYRHSLQQAVQWGARSLVRERQLTQAFPSISTGVYGYPKEAATHAAVETVTQFLQEPQGEQVGGEWCLTIRSTWWCFAAFPQATWRCTSALHRFMRSQGVDSRAKALHGPGARAAQFVDGRSR